MSSELREDGTTSSVAWGLRTKGEGEYSVIVRPEGLIDREGKTRREAKVRPALWIDIIPWETWDPWDDEDAEC